MAGQKLIKFSLMTIVTGALSDKSDQPKKIVPDKATLSVVVFRIHLCSAQKLKYF